MLDLTTLKFSVDTSELDSAMSKMSDLASSVEKLNRVNVNRAKVEKDLSTEIDKSAKAQENLAKSTKDLADKLDPAEKLLQKLNNQYGDLVSGFTKGEAAILQQARAIGVAEDALAPFKSILEKIKELTKDPFDASIGALRSVTKEFDAITQRATLAAQGISLTTKQLGEYSRIAAEVKGQVSKMGLDPTQGKGLETYNMLLKETQADYLQVALAVNRAKDAEELRNKTLRESEKLMAQVAAEQATMMDQAVVLFQRNEERKIKAAEDAAERIRRANESVADSIQRINYMTEQVNKGMSAGEASKRFDLAQQGVSPEQINALIAAENKLASARKANASVLAETTANTNDAAKATQWLERELARAENAVADFNKNLGTSSANKMFRFSEQLQKAGLNPEEAKALMDRYGAAIAAGQAKMHRDMEARLRDLSRAVSVQMGDVAVSLASGMNPFTVMIQQGDQLRGAFQMVDASAAEVNKSMQVAAGMIAKSFIDTGKAIGSFFTGAIVSAGTTTVDFAKSVVTTIFPALDGWRNRMLSVHGLASEMPAIVKIFDSGVAAASVGAGVAIAALVAGVTALGIAFYKTSNQQDELSKNLILTGASMGYTTDGALALAKSMEVVGLSTDKSLQIINAFAKEGAGSMSQMREIIPAVADAMKYLGLSADDMAKQYANLAKDPVKALAELGKNTGLVSIETFNTVMALTEAGDKTGAVTKAVQEANKVYTQAAQDMKREYSNLGIVFINVKSQFSKFWSSVTDSVYKDTPAEAMTKQYQTLSNQLESARTKLHRFLGSLGMKGYADDVAALEAQVAGAKEMITLSRQQAEAQARAKEAASKDIAITEEQRDVNKKLSDALDSANKKIMTRAQFIEMYVQKQRDASKYQEIWDDKLIAKAKEVANAEYDRMHRSQENQKVIVDGVGAFEEVYKRQIKQQEWLNSLIDKSSGYTSTYSEDVERLNKMLTEGVDGITTTADQYRKYLRALEELQPYMKKQIAAEAELVKMNTQMNAALDERAQAVQVEYEMMGKSASEKERLLRLLKVETEYKKELAAIDEKIAKGDLIDPILISLQKKAAEDTRNKGITIVNKEETLKAIREIESELGSSSSIYKSSERLAATLKEAGNTGFANLISSLGKVTDGLEQMVLQQEAYNKLKQDKSLTEVAKIEVRQQQAQVKNYGDMIGAAKGFFKEGSSGYKTLLAAEKAFRVYEMAMAVKSAAVAISSNAERVAAFILGEETRASAAVAGSTAATAATVAEGQAKAATAIATQGSGDPYTAFARIAAMTAIMAGLGFMVSGGGSSGSFSSNNGTGTVFGDKTAKSESVNRSIEILAKNSDVGLNYSQKMLAALNSISNNIGGLTNFVLRAPGVTTGEDFNVSSGTKLPGAIGSLVGTVTSKLPIIGKLVNSLFGSKTSITGTGLFMGPSQLGNIIGGDANLQSYVDTYKTQKFFGITIDKQRDREFKNADAALNSQFSKIFASFYDAIKASAGPLGANLADVEQKLKTFVVNIGAIDLKDLSGEQIKEKLTAVFGAAADKIGKYALPGLEDFQKVGEGYLETLVRVSSGVETAKSALDRLGIAMVDYSKLATKSGDITLELLRESILKTETVSTTVTNKTIRVPAVSPSNNPFATMIGATAPFWKMIGKSWEDGFDEFANTIIGNTTKLVDRVVTVTETTYSGVGEILKNFSGSAEEFVSLYTDLMHVRDALKAIGQTGVELSSYMIKGAGNMDKLKSNVDLFFNEFLTDQERFNSIQKRVREEFAKAGFQMPDTKEAFKKLVQDAQQSLNSAVNQEKFGKLIGLTESFKEYLDALENMSSSTMADLTQRTKELQIELLRVQGKTEAANAAFRELSTQGMTDAEKAVWDYNTSLQKQIDDTSKQVELQNKILELQGNTNALRELELQKLSPVNQELQKMIWSMESAASAAAKAAAENEKYVSTLTSVLNNLGNTKFDLENQLLTLQGNQSLVDARTRARDLDELTKALSQADKAIITAMYDANVSLKNQIANKQAEIKASEEAAAASAKYAESLQGILTGLGNTKFDLENELLSLNGNQSVVDARTRQKELDELTKGLNAADKATVTAMYDANLALKKQLENRQAELKAAEELKSAWQSVTDSIFEEVKRIRGLTQSDSVLGFAALMNKFNATNSAAAAGDQEAAKNLPELSRQLLELGAQQATSLVELRRLQMLTANALEKTGNSLTNKYGLTIPAFASGGEYSGGLALVGENGPELINFNSGGRVFNNQETTSILNSNVSELLTRMNENLDNLRIEVRAGVSHTAKTSKILDRLVTDGQSLNVRFVETPNVHVV